MPPTSVVDMADFDLAMMQRAAEIAQEGYPSPNPHVGAVLTRGRQVLAEGFHARAGDDHAEVDAIRKARRKGHRTESATLYVTMTPCHHVGRTPPCTKAIIEAGIRRVVVGSRDPKPHNPGAAEFLRTQHIQVDEDVGKALTDPLIRDFSKHITTGLPYVIAKTAMTLDGKIATRTKDSKWITDDVARQDVHRVRDKCDAIIVGLSTVVWDNPALTVRLERSGEFQPRPPIRVVLDPLLEVPFDAKLVASAKNVPTWVAHQPSALEAKKAALMARGVHCFEVPAAQNDRPEPKAHLSLPDTVRYLGERGVVRLLVEGGAETISSFLKAQLIDEWLVYIGPKILADARATDMANAFDITRMQDALQVRYHEVKMVGSSIRIRATLGASKAT